MALNNKTKYYILVSIIPFCFFLCWKLAVSASFELNAELRQNALNIQQLNNPDLKIIQLTNHLKELEENNITDPEQLDDRLIEMLSKQLIVNDVLLESISEIHSVNSANYTIKTFKILFSGKYSNLLFLLDFIQKELEYFEPVSSNFHKEELRDGNEKLYLDLYLQTFINKNLK
jgi:hypothetical protein